jgi:N-methylhydantoinase A
MQSNGGMATCRRRARRHRIVRAGRGVTAGAFACRTGGFRNIITFDMGGTSCDVALIKDGEPLLASRGKIEGRDLAVPMLDINTVSAGGGTIAEVDRFGLLQVGPRSAGRAGAGVLRCGGAAATITDYNLVLGYLGEDTFLGGRMRLDAAEARAAIGAKVARPLRTVRGGSGGRRRARHRRQDGRGDQGDFHHARARPARLHALAFGGAGPCMPAASPRDLGMAGVVVPRYPGVFSAIGLLLSDVQHDYIRSQLTLLSETAPAAVSSIFEQLAARALDELRGDGFARDRIRIARCSTCAMPARATRSPFLSVRALQAADLEQLRLAFDLQHGAMFGHMAPEEPVEIVSYRVRGIGLVPPVAMPKFERAGARSPTRGARCGACGSTPGSAIARSISASGSTSASSSPARRSSTSSTARP